MVEYLHLSHQIPRIFSPFRQHYYQPIPTIAIRDSLFKSPPSLPHAHSHTYLGLEWGEDSVLCTLYLYQSILLALKFVQFDINATITANCMVTAIMERFNYRYSL